MHFQGDEDILVAEHVTYYATNKIVIGEGMHFQDLSAVL